MAQPQREPRPWSSRRFAFVGLGSGDGAWSAASSPPQRADVPALSVLPPHGRGEVGGVERSPPVVSGHVSVEDSAAALALEKGGMGVIASFCGCVHAAILR